MEIGGRLGPRYSNVWGKLKFWVCRSQKLNMLSSSNFQLSLFLMSTMSYLKLRTIRGTPHKWVGFGKPLFLEGILGSLQCLVSLCSNLWCQQFLLMVVAYCLPLSGWPSALRCEGARINKGVMTVSGGVLCGTLSRSSCPLFTPGMSTNY